MSNSSVRVELIPPVFCCVQSLLLDKRRRDADDAPSNSSAEPAEARASKRQKTEYTHSSQDNQDSILNASTNLRPSASPKRKQNWAASPPKRPKRGSFSPTANTSWPWLRSGRVFAHTLVIEAATIQVQSLSEFELAPEYSCSGTVVARSSQSTITEPSLPSTPAILVPGSSAPSSPLARSSQTSTIAPWTPQSSRSSQTSTVAPWIPPNASPCGLHQYRYTGSRPVPVWYAECFESDGYDSEALALIATPPREHAPESRMTSVLPVSTPPRGSPLSSKRPAPSGSRVSTPFSPASSPGFVVVRDTALSSARDDWQPEVWPDEVRYVQAQYNPRNWKFPHVGSGFRGGAGCDCDQRCNASTCLNARSGRFCNRRNCSFGGMCGNYLRESPALVISRNMRTGMRGLTASAPIPAGEVIGEYFGHLQLFGPPCKNGSVNEGYRMHLKTKTIGNKYVGIDALHAGGKLRLMNHSCNPAARFHEVQTGRDLTVVAVTIRDVFPGEEVTISYGDNLWFVCRGGWWGCQHRDIQHLPNAVIPPWVKIILPPPTPAPSPDTNSSQSCSLTYIIHV